jgi:ADP-heptose:LPS heptosyltransferase
MIFFVKNKLRNFDKMRRQKLHLLESLMYRLIKNDSALETALVPNDQVKRILLMRNNKRIGNILFFIPLVRQVRHAYPNATIDLLLSQPWQGQFFDGLGMDRIYYSHFSFMGILKWLKAIEHLNQVKYDLILAPNCCASDATTAAMIAAKNKVSSYKERRILAFPHSLKISLCRPHAAYGCLSLLEALGHPLDKPLNHNLAFSNDELSQGIIASRKYTTQDDSIDLVFFRGARGAKHLPPAIWEAILKKFEAGIDKKINWIEVLSPDVNETLRKNTAIFETKNLRLLGAFLRNFDGFICCDTGPLHLADASGVPCVGLYTHTTPGSFGLLGEKSVHVTDINNFNASEVVRKLGLVIKQRLTLKKDYKRSPSLLHDVYPAAV